MRLSKAASPKSQLRHHRSCKNQVRARRNRHRRRTGSNTRRSKNHRERSATRVWKTQNKHSRQEHKFTQRRNENQRRNKQMLLLPEPRATNGGERQRPQAARKRTTASRDQKKRLSAKTGQEIMKAPESRRKRGQNRDESASGTERKPKTQAEPRRRKEIVLLCETE